MNTLKPWMCGAVSFLILCSCALAQSKPKAGSTAPGMPMGMGMMMPGAPGMPIPTVSIEGLKFVKADSPISAKSLSSQIGRPYKAKQNRFVAVFFVHAEVGLDESAFLAMAKESPDGEDVKMLCSQDQVLSIKPGRTGNIMMHDYQITLAAPTLEQAGRLAKRFVDVYNKAWPSHRTRLLGNVIAKAQKKLDESHAKVKGMKGRLDYHSGTLKGVELVNKQTMEEFRIKLLLLDVDIAGEKARARSIRGRITVLKDGDVSQRQKLEELAIMTDIDLAGLLARREQIGRIFTANMMIPRLTAEIRNEDHSIEWTKRYLQSLKDALGRPASSMELRCRRGAFGEIRPIAWEETSRPASKQLQP